MRRFDFNGETYTGFKISDNVFERIGTTKGWFLYHGFKIAALFYSGGWYCCILWGSS